MQPHRLLIFAWMAANGLAAQTPDARVIETFFHQPDITAKDVDACVIGEVHPDSEKFYVRMGNYGKTTPIVSQAWDAGAFTGLQVPAGFQFGPMATETSTAVQVHGREIGIWIDSDHPRPALGSLLPITPAYWWWDFAKAPMPFAKEGVELGISFDMKVPTASREGEAQPYITVNFLFLDTRSQKQFWLAANLFDMRPESQFPDTVLFRWLGGRHADSHSLLGAEQKEPLDASRQGFGSFHLAAVCGVSAL